MQSGIPRVSVVIPCFNGEHFIAQAIESVLGQTFREFEIIAVDDGSADRSRDIVRRYLSDGRVRLVEHAENRGVAAARNTGVKGSNAEFIAFLDQDDFWRPDKLERQIGVFERDAAGKIGMIFSDVEVIESGGRRPRRRSPIVPRGFNDASRLEVLRAMLRRNFVPMTTALIRRSCFDDVGHLDERIRSGADDYEFCLRLAQKYRLVYLRDRLATRRHHEAQFTDDERLAPDTIRIIERVIEKNRELAPLKSKKRGELLYRLGRAHHKKGRRREAIRAYRDSLRARPAYVKALAALALCGMGRYGNRVLDGWIRFRRRIG